MPRGTCEARGRLRACPERSRMGQSPLPRNGGEDEERAAAKSEKQTHDPEVTFPCKRGDCRDSNRDLEHGYAAREYFVLVKV
jgi:hypothetical protein